MIAYPRSRKRYWRRRLALVLVLAVGAWGALLVRDEIRNRVRGYSSTHGNTIVRYTIASRLLHRSLSEVAVVPPGGDRRPLLVLLHGREDHRNGPESMLSDALLEGLRALGRRAPVVALLNGGGHSYYHDRRDGPWASMLLREAIPGAARRFHTLPGRIAIGGISMGGYGALHLASLGPREFCAVGGHSAAVWTSGGMSAPGAFDDAEDFTRNDVIAAARAGRFDHIRVWIDGGDRDPFHDADRELASIIRARGNHVSYHVWPGGHDGAYWHAHMSAYLRFYAGALASCRAA
jgi:enterochelin esterase-like enzyme